MANAPPKRASPLKTGGPATDERTRHIDAWRRLTWADLKHFTDDRSIQRGCAYQRRRSIRQEYRRRPRFTEVLDGVESLPIAGAAKSTRRW